MKIVKKGRSFTKLGLPEVFRPKFASTLVFPSDITELTAQNISDLIGKYTLLYSYANQELSKLNVLILQSERREEIRVNDLFRTRPSLNQIEKWRRDSVLAEDTEIEEIRTNINRLQIQKEFTQMYLSNFDRYVNALSRELTRKTHESPYPARV